jgi:DNA-cytosine methyltransferase
MPAPIPIARVLTTGGDDAALAYLKAAREHHSQAKIASYLGTTPRTIRRWEARQSVPPPYVVHALQQLLPLDLPFVGEAAFSFIDLFAGIGGIRRAFEGVGGRCVFTSEWDSYAQKTYAENFRDGHAIHGDITQIQAADIPDHDVLLAGFPCQPFSIAGVSKKNALGRAHGFACETQGTLFFDVARIVAEKQPRAFLLENVKNLVSHDKGRTFDVIKRTLTQELGYHIHTRVIDAAHFVPQHRERILIVGFREPVAFDFDALPLPPKGQRSLKEILHRSDGSEPVLASDEGRFFDHTQNQPHPKYTLTDNLWRYLQAYAEKHRAKGNGFGFGLVTPDNIARTLSARYYKDGSEILVSQGKRKNPRRLTPRECARLMGFSDTYKIPVSDTRAYRLFAEAAVVPMVEAVAKLLLPNITVEEVGNSTQKIEMPKNMMSSNRWTKEQVMLAFHLYCQTPFGKIDGRNKEIIALSKIIGRTADAVAMKMLNISSLDPIIVNSGRKGLGNASALDREVWDEFHADWEKLALKCALLNQQLQTVSPTLVESALVDNLDLTDFSGETRQVLTEQRVKQNFFRRAVLASYRGRCCMSGLSDSRLLVASHIVPWCKDKLNRLNPSNGLCLSALHDKAFDRGLITLSNDFTILVSDQLHKLSSDWFVNSTLVSLHNRPIEQPEKFLPLLGFLERHRSEIYVDSAITPK